MVPARLSIYVNIEAGDSMSSERVPLCASGEGGSSVSQLVSRSRNPKSDDLNQCTCTYIVFFFLPFLAALTVR